MKLRSLRQQDDRDRLHLLVRGAVNASRRLQRATRLGASPLRLAGLCSEALRLLQQARARAYMLDDEAGRGKIEKEDAVHGDAT